MTAPYTQRQARPAPPERHAPDSMEAIESRMGLEPLAALHAKRDALVRRVADLRARHGPFGTYNDLRKIKLAAIAQLVRIESLKAKERKLTANEVDDRAHCHPDYELFVIQATTERAQWAVLENQIQAVDEVIFRQQAIARYLAAEVRMP